MTRPTVNRLTYIDGVWTVGAEVPRPRPWGRWIANAAALLVTLAAIFAGVCVAVESVADMPHVFL